MSIETLERDKLIFDPPGPDCVLYLPGLPGGGGYLFDRSHHNNICAITGAAWERTQGGLWTTRYDGTDDWLCIDSVLNDLAATTKGTWMGWFKLDDATPASTTRLISFGDTNANEILAIHIGETGNFSFFAVKAGVAQSVGGTTAAALANGAWGHLAVIQDGTAPALLVNGVEVAQTFSVQADETVWFGDLAGLDNGRIGCKLYNSAAATNFITNGNTAMVKIFNTSLAVAAVLNDHYNIDLH